MSEKIEEWINVDQAAEFFGVKPATIRDWIRKGKGIPATKIGKQWKFKSSELDAWAKSGAAADDGNSGQSVRRFRNGRCFDSGITVHLF